MKLEWFITKRIAGAQGKSFSQMIVRIATFAIALSLAVMIITSALVRGFQETITDKVYGFMGHVLVSKIDSWHDQNSYDDLPINHPQPFLESLAANPEVDHIQSFGRKAGIIKNRDNIEGIIVRGIDADFDMDFFSKFMIEGTLPAVMDTVRSDEIVISKSTKRRMKFELGDDVVVFFIDQSNQGSFRQRARKFKVSGVYNTGLEEFDRLFAIVDMEHIRKINQWDENQVGGYEIFLNQSAAKKPAALFEWTEYADQEVGAFLQVHNIRELEPNIFDWLSLQNQNERIILALMMIVALINMVTSLLILILERTQMIGVLKALGARDWDVRKIFILNAAYIIGIGLFWGNVLGIGFCLLQQEFGLIRLPEESYYVTVAPIAIDWLRIVLLNVLTMLVCTVFLLLPSWLVTRIDPIRALRFR